MSEPNNEKAMPLLVIKINHRMRPASLDQLINVTKRLKDKYKDHYQTVVIPQEGIEVGTSDCNAVLIDVTDENTALNLINILDKELWREEKKDGTPKDADIVAGQQDAATE